MPAFDAQSPDGLLIAAALAGEEDAFAHLVHRYQPALFKAANSRLGARELAEEAVQEAFLCAHRWLHTYDSRFSFRTWLWTILLNQCTRQARREAKHFRATAADGVQQALDRRSAHEEVRCPEAPPLERLLERENSDLMNGLLARLPEAQADALRLRFFGGLTFPEIATTMRSSEAGAKHRVKSGLLKLSEWLTEHPREKTANQL